MPHRIGVMFVEQVIQAGRNSQFSQKFLGIERGISRESASYLSANHGEPAADFLPLETREKLLPKQRSDEIDLSPDISPKLSNRTDRK